jgi:hypothetical protein
MVQRVAKWAVIDWNVLWVGLVVAWLQNPALEWGKFSGGAATTGPRAYPATKPPDWLLFDYWFLGLLALASLWAVARWWAARHRDESQVTFPHAD